MTEQETAGMRPAFALFLRGFYFEGWHPHDKPIKERKKEAFLAAIGPAFHDSADVDSEELSRKVFAVLVLHLSPGEIKHVKLTLPHELRDLWAEGTHTLWF